MPMPWLKRIHHHVSDSSCTCAIGGIGSISYTHREVRVKARWYWLRNWCFSLKLLESSSNKFINIAKYQNLSSLAQHVSRHGYSLQYEMMMYKLQVQLGLASVMCVDYSVFVSPGWIWFVFFLFMNLQVQTFFLVGWYLEFNLFVLFRFLCCLCFCSLRLKGWLKLCKILLLSVDGFHPLVIFSHQANEFSSSEDHLWKKFKWSMNNYLID